MDKAIVKICFTSTEISNLGNVRQYGFIFSYDYEKELNVIEQYKIEVIISNELSLDWNLNFGDDEIKQSEQILKSVAKDKIIEKVNKTKLQPYEKIELNLSCGNSICPSIRKTQDKDLEKFTIELNY